MGDELLDSAENAATIGSEHLNSHLIAALEKGCRRFAVVDFLYHAALLQTR